MNWSWPPTAQREPADTGGHSVSGLDPIPRRHAPSVGIVAETSPGLIVTLS